MADGRHTAAPDAPQRLPMRASTLGTVYCVLSAVFYTLMGICQRELSQNCDPVLVNCVQASVSTTVFGVYLVIRSVRGRSAWPPLAVAAGLMMLGAVTQLGASAYQWSLGVIGLAIGNPLQMGVMLAAAALLGWLVLGERVAWRGVMAIVLITASVPLLSLGAEAASQSLQKAEPVEASRDRDTEEPGGSDRAVELGGLRVPLGVAAACFAGVAFAVLTVGMRKTATENTSPEAIVFFINVMGILFLGPWVVAQLGLDRILATSPRDLAVMLATGACNLMGFLLLAKALQLTTVVRVNVINNALTTVLTVAAGIVIFTEPSNRQLVIGIVLTLVGIVLISFTDSEEAGRTPAAAESAAQE